MAATRRKSSHHAVQQPCDHLERVTLVDQKLLPLCAVVHLLCILGHEGVEEGVELALARARHHGLFWPKDPAEPLGLLQCSAHTRRCGVCNGACFLSQSASHDVITGERRS